MIVLKLRKLTAYDGRNTYAIAVADLDIRHIRNGECQILDPFEIP